MLLVSQDLLHVDKHYETYDEDGVYLGKMDKDTMLLYEESRPFCSSQKEKQGLATPFIIASNVLI